MWMSMLMVAMWVKMAAMAERRTMIRIKMMLGMIRMAMMWMRALMMMTVQDDYEDEDEAMMTITRTRPRQ